MIKRDFLKIIKLYRRPFETTSHENPSKDWKIPLQLQNLFWISSYHFFHGHHGTLQKGKICEGMSCEESKIIVCICRYDP